MAIVLRSVKGAPLTNDEADGNIVDLRDRVVVLEGAGASRSIDHISQVDNTLIVYYTDTTQSDPFSLGAINLRARDEWQPLTSYLKYDLITYNGSGYIVMVDHTSAASFDPHANGGGPPDYYMLVFTSPDNVLPLGGDEHQILRKSSDSDLQTEWADPLLSELFDVDFPTGEPDTGDVLVWDGAAWTSGHDALSALTDVDIGSGLEADDFLKWDGAAWVSDPLTPEDRRSSTVTALGTTGTVSLDPTLGDVFSITPTGAVTLNAASAPAGAHITVVVTTSGTSSYNITPSTNFKSTGALATGTASGKVFTLSFVGDGTNLNEVARTAAM